MKHKQKLKWGYAIIPIDKDEVWDSFQLIQRFGIPDDSHLVVDSVIWITSVAGAQVLLWDDLSKEKGDTGTTLRTNKLRVRTATANEDKQYVNLGIEIYDRLRFFPETSAANDWSIGYYYAKGSMHITDDIAEQLGDMRVIGARETTAGQEFHKTGDFKRLGVEN